MNEPGALEDLRRARQSMWRTRWVLVGLSAVLAMVLVLSGAVVIGAIIGVMAIVRAVMIVRWRQHTPWLGQRYRGAPPER